MIIRTTGPHDRNLGATIGRANLDAVDRRDAYRLRVRQCGLDRDPEHALRVRHGLIRQASLHCLPVPRHRALVVV